MTVSSGPIEGSIGMEIGHQWCTCSIGYMPFPICNSHLSASREDIVSVCLYCWNGYIQCIL